MDRQTMLPKDFRIVVIDDGRDPARRRSLESLVTNRTNIQLIDTSGAARSGIDAALQQVNGSYVLVLEDGDGLTPRALERLCDLADETAADICLGKTSRRGARVETPGFATNQARIPVEQARQSPDCLRLYRSSFLRDSFSVDNAPVSAMDRRALGLTESVAWCADTPAFTRTAQDSKGPQARWTAQMTALRWVRGKLEVSGELTEPTGTSLSSDDLQVQGCVFRPNDGVEWAVDANPVVARMSSAPGKRWALSLDPAVAASGSALAPGLWQLALFVTDAAGTERIKVSVTGRVLMSSYHDGSAYVAHGDGGTLGLDVGARSHPVVPRLQVDTASVSENAQGSLLTADVPDLEMIDGGRLEGELRVGDLPVKAWVEADASGRTVLKAWVSGLAGSYDLASRFSTAKFAPTGARLVIDAVGDMRVERVRGKKRARPKAPVTAPRKPAPRWRVWAKKVPGATMVYRQVNRLAERGGR